ncbi:MAG TPA: RNA methyltransferase [Candidatus Elarobacter sp.]
MATRLSPSNPRIEALRKLAAAKGRREAGRFVAEGTTMLEEAQRSGSFPLEIYGTATALDAAAGRFAGPETAAFEIEERSYERVTTMETWEGILGVFAIPETSLASIVARPGPILLLAEVGDPGNAGTLVRSAEAFGAAGVLFGRGGADPYGPKVVRATMGSIFRVPVATVEAEPVLAAAQASGRPVFATDLAGDDLHTVAIPGNAIIAIGNELRGVRGWLPRWDRAVRIPHERVTESLNAAVAGSIVLYESRRVK